MREEIAVKVCGLTLEEDVNRCLDLGADYCGFIVYEASPRGIALVRAQELSSNVPAGKRVLVDVAPRLEVLMTYLDAGFDFFQIHEKETFDEGYLEAVSELVGKNRLWLSPRFGPDQPFPEAYLHFADTFLVDTFSKDQVGGTGQTGDWGAFSTLKNRYPQKQWILAGGLSPSNIREAVALSDSTHVDVNSGVESRAGVKELEKLQVFFRALRG
ncbi:MAG: phosphoribosylanthranilate isomerase [Lentimonas sp.]